MGYGLRTEVDRDDELLGFGSERNTCHTASSSQTELGIIWGTWDFPDCSPDRSTNFAGLESARQ